MRFNWTNQSFVFCLSDASNQTLKTNNQARLSLSAQFSSFLNNIFSIFFQAGNDVKEIFASARSGDQYRVLKIVIEDGKQRTSYLFTTFCAKKRLNSPLCPKVVCLCVWEKSLQCLHFGLHISVFQSSWHWAAPGKHPRSGIRNTIP